MNPNTTQVIQELVRSAKEFKIDWAKKHPNVEPTYFDHLDWIEAQDTNTNEERYK